MCSENTLNLILSKTSNSFKNIYGDLLKSVILYGSYARGDFDDESDIDVAALVDLDRASLQKTFNKVVDFSSDIGLEYNIMLSPSIIPYSEFLKYKNDLPYYTNIAKEGVVVDV